MIQGLSHLTFVVRDLDRMEEILTTIVGARKVYDSGAGSHSLSRERFFVAGGAAGDGRPVRHAADPTVRSREDLEGAVDVELGVVEPDQALGGAEPLDPHLEPVAARIQREGRF